MTVSICEDPWLFVIIAFIDEVQVYSCEPPYQRTNDITVKGIDCPVDITSSKDGDLLILDSTGLLWTIKVTDDLQDVIVVSKRYVRDCYDQIQSISLTSGGRIMMPDYQDLNVACKCSCMHREHEVLFQLNSRCKPKNAIQMRDNQYIVLGFDDKKEMVNKISVFEGDGREIVSFGDNDFLPGEMKLNNPSHIALSENGDVFVADKNNGRILVFNRELKLVRTVQTKFEDVMYKPHRLCYDNRRRELMVATTNGDLLVLCIQQPALSEKW